MEDWQKEAKRQAKKDAKRDRKLEDDRTMAHTDYENTRGRVRTGGKREVAADKMPMLSNAWQYNSSGVEDLELRRAGVSMGYSSVNFEMAAVQIASIMYAKNRARWQNMDDEAKEAIYAAARDKRAAREWDEVRHDSINRKSAEIYKEFLEQRTKEDPSWMYDSHTAMAKMDGRDTRSAHQMARKWRFEVDEDKWQALVVKYCAWLEGIKPDSMRTRFKRKPEQRDLAGFVTSVDCLACGVVVPGGFDKEALLSEIGDELAMEMNTPRDDLERRDFIINASHDLYAGGALFPPYVYQSLDEMLESVVLLLEASGYYNTRHEEAEWGAA